MIEFYYFDVAKITVISVGKDNSYGYPEKKILERLESRNIKILRTDEIGSIEILSDGKNISINN